MSVSHSHALKRNRLVSVLLRPLGLHYWGVEQTEVGLVFRGKGEQPVSLSEMSGPVSVGKSHGFHSLIVPSAGGDRFTIAGVNREAAATFASSINDALRRYVAEKGADEEEELRTLAKAIAHLQQPRRFPSACLLDPFLTRAAEIGETFPDIIPEGALSANQLALLSAARSFHEAPEIERENAIERFIKAELETMKLFFDEIETNPLTPEQRLAVVMDEDATLVLAGAGSGKTSVIVAKAAYLIERGVRHPQEILLMAFGKDAAAEMASRIKERAGASVDALTFHALGYSILRDVEGCAPALAAHASDDAQFRSLLRDILVAEVANKAGMKSLLLEWFADFFWPYKSEWDFETRDEYYRYVEAHELRTFNGELVKSFEELQIANWLYRNGIAYEYEPNYEHEIRSNTRRAYTPDFRLSDSGIYIEHFGVRKAKQADGSTRLTTAPHIDRDRYLEDMAWKRKVHRDHGTTLIETYSYERVEGRLTTALANKLAPHVTCEPISEDQLFDRLSQLGQVDSFTQTLGTFLRHFKSSGATLGYCRSRVDAEEDSQRGKAFLTIFEPLFDAYQRRLGERIDFEDMVVRAAGYVESGRYKSPYRHLLVDEFQDISAGRARLLKALKGQYADARLFAVGDDWQSIYRFTGSDVHLMRNFGREFGGSFAGKAGIHSVVDLGRTFRSIDKIALPARRFILQNPFQLDKAVITATQGNEPAILVAYYTGARHDAALVGALERIASVKSEKATVLLLGRYHFLKPRNLRELAARYPDMSISFMTMHASKGLEADHVIVLRAEAGTKGFPSEIVDDPLLDLVLPEPEKFDHAEERRLFYVALTRARKSVTILTNREKPSVLVRELADDPAYEVAVLGEPGIADHRCGACGGRMLAQTSGKNRVSFACEHSRLCGQKLNPCSACGQDLPKTDPTHPHALSCSCGAEFPACPKCDNGWLIERRGKYGSFLGCVHFPACTGTQQLTNAKGTSRRQGRRSRN
ncbi:MAG: UvrD-helicase domain-containing protein [Sphingomonadaceae bacterium]